MFIDGLKDCFCSLLLEIQKALDLFEKQRVHDQIQIDNFERYKRLRNQRREQEGLS